MTSKSPKVMKRAMCFGDTLLQAVDGNKIRRLTWEEDGTYIVVKEEVWGILLVEIRLCVKRKGGRECQILKK